MEQVRIRSFSLRTLVVCLVLAATLVVAVPATLWSSRLYSLRLRDALEQKGLAIAELMAQNIRASVDFDDPESARQILSGARRDPDLAYAVVLKGSGEIFAAGVRTLPRAAPKMGRVARPTIRQAGGQIHVAAPILAQEGPMAVVQLGFSLERLDREITAANYSEYLAAGAMSLIIVALLLLLLGLTVIRPIEQITRAIQRFGEGDLETPLPVSKTLLDASEIRLIRQALARTVALLRENVAAIKQTSEDLSRISGEIKSNTSEFSSAASQQVNALNESAATVGELEVAGKASEGSAGDIVANARRSVEITERGLDAAEISSNQFSGIRSQIEAIVASITRLSQQFALVDEIITSVADVAQMSQLLAVNASIEADQAGEAGVGFGVVAREVRDLADQSKRATDRVRSTLAGIQHAIEEVAMASALGRERIEAGVESIDRTGQVIRDLARFMAGAAEMANRIAVNTKQQVFGLEQMSAAMHEINDVAERNLYLVRGLDARSEQLRGKAEELSAAVSHFRLAAPEDA